MIDKKGRPNDLPTIF